MNTQKRGNIVAGICLAMLAMSACSSSHTAVNTGVQPAGSLTPAQQAAADGGIPPYTPADVHFMSGMIGHHAQAVVMAGWAPSHGASESIRALCERIVVAQTDEITLMSRWLRDRHQPVPTPDPRGHMMPGMDHPMLMPGMLTPEQMAELDHARGQDFDRLFLTYMIQHHEGAITMVNELFATYGAAQDDVVFKFATDVNADQTTEINRMTLMLDAMPGGRGQ